MNICLFTKEEITKPLSLLDQRAEHIIKFLHKTVNDTFFAGIINGKSGNATITKVDSDFLYFEFNEGLESKPLAPLIMIIGFPRPIQLKRLLRDMSALGVLEVHLTQTQLTEKSYLKSNLLENGGAEKMLLDGTVQAGSTFVPKLVFHQSVKECIEYFNSKMNNQIVKKIALDNVNATCSLSSTLKNIDDCELKDKNILAAIGSERGWTYEERLLLEQNGFIRCSMGSRIMRTETASTVAGAIILDKMGNLN